jgi:hypothetical protein
MLNRFRSVVSALAIASLVLGLASPTLAVDRLAEVDDDPASVPMIFDVAVMRPLGLMATIGGTLFYVFPVVPLMAMTRPADIAKPLGPLVVTPARFTFSDPIGQHPMHP